MLLLLCAVLAHEPVHSPPALIAAQRKMELAMGRAAKEIKIDDGKFDELDKKIEIDAAKEEHKHHAIEDKFEKRMSDSQDAFKASIHREELKSRQEGSELMKHFEASMEGVGTKATRGLASSFLQTGAAASAVVADKTKADVADKAKAVVADTAKADVADTAKADVADKAKADEKTKADAAAEAALEAKVMAQAQALSQTKLGSKMRDMLQSMTDDRYTNEQRIAKGQAQQHRQLMQVKAGLAKEEARLKEYTLKENDKRDLLQKKLTENDKNFAKKLADDEVKFQAHAKASHEKWQKKAEKSREWFEKKEKEANEEMESSFVDTSDSSESSLAQTADPNLRSGA